MVSVKINFLIVLAAFFLLFPSDFHAQKKRIRTKKPNKITKKTKPKKRISPKIISGGVMNGKALSLVKPTFPAAARKIGIHGTVVVQILIDENGNVIEATALSGNPLLIPNSVKAAKLSKFEPQIISGTFYKVRGVIHYIYIAERLNWLEIGYGFENPSYYYSNKLEAYLPSGFEEERQMLIQNRLIDFDRQDETRLTIISSIENKLASNDKNRWLFAVGREIGRLSNSNGNVKTESLEKIQNLLYSIPANVSPILKQNLENLISSSKDENGKFNQVLIKLVERLYGLGN